MFAGANPQRTDHRGVWVELFLRYHLSKTRITSEQSCSNVKAFECYPFFVVVSGYSYFN